MAPDKKKLRKKLVGLVALYIGFRHLTKQRRQLSFGGPSSPFNEYMETSQDSPNPPPSASTSRTRKSDSKRSRSSKNEERVDLVADNLGQVADFLVEPEWVGGLYTKVREMQEFPQALLEKAFDYLCAHRLEGLKFMYRDQEARFEWLESFARDNPI